MHNKSRLKHYHSKPIFEELEARQLFSAGVEALLTEQIPVPEATYANDAPAGMPVAESQQQPVITLDSKTEPYQIVFVDTSVEGYQTLIDDITNNAAAGSKIEVVQLDDSKDGIAQITEILADRDNLDAIHIISHGSDGSIDLGNSQLNFDTLIQNQQDITGWGNAFKENGDILLYGCNVAETQFGQSFVDYLAGITNADIAASTDATGNADLGGDWQLEYQTGAIESQVAVSATEQSEWSGLMAVTSGSISSTYTNGASSLTWMHTVDAGTNRALFVEVSINDPSVSVTGITYGGVALTKVGRSAGSHAVEIWALTNPNLGSANVVVSFSGSTEAAAGATTFHGVNQTTPYGTFAAASGTGTVGSVTVASAVGDKVIDVQYWQGAPSGGTAGSAQSIQWWQRPASNSMTAGSTVETATSASVVMNTNFTSSAYWQIAGVSVKASTYVAPVNTVPGAQSTNEDTTKVFSVANGNAISISDSDAGTTSNEITLTVTNGTLTLAGTTGLTFVAGDGTADSTITVRGTSSAINTALNGLSYTPTANYTGSATLTVSTKDSVLLSLNIDTSLKGRYTFDSTGALGTDTSPAAGYNGTVVNGTSVNDATRGNVLSLAGNGYIQTTGHYGNPANVTLAAWVNLTTADISGSVVISLGDSVGISLDNAGRLDGFYYNGTNWPQTFYTTTLAGAGWHHVAYTFNDAGNMATLYLDGVAVGSLATTDSISYTLGADSFIGKHGNGSTTYDFTGKIDDARVYSRVLTADEIATLASDLAKTDTDTVAITVSAVNDAPNDLYAINGAAESSLVGVYGFTNPTNLGRDAAGNNAPITFYGNPGQTTGPDGSGALDLAGGTSGQYGDIVGITTGGAMTFAASVRFDTLGNWQRVFDFGQTNSSGIGAIYVGRLSNTSDLTFTIEKDLGGGVWQVYRATATNAITNGNWMHFTATVDVSGNMALYLNGSLAATATGVAPDVGVRTNNYIGKSNWAGDAAFDGAIDNFVVANGAMNASQVAALYQQTSGFSVAENAANGTVVGTVVGYDVDASANPTYSLTDSAGGRFAINSTNGTLTVADGSLLNYEAATSHSITVQVTDSLGANYSETYTVSVSNVVEAPSATNLSTSESYTEDTALNLTDIVITRGDSATVTATLTLSNAAAGSLNTATSGAVTSTYNSTTGVWTASGAVADVNTLLAGLTFTPASNFNSNFTITTSVSDGVLAAVTGTKAMTGIAVNDAPVLTFISGNANYPENYGAVIVSSSATVTDVDSSNFDTGQMRVYFSANGQAEDRIGIQNQGSRAGQIGVSGANVSYGGVVIGTYTGGTDGSTPLVVTFNANATVAAVQALGRSITYQNVSDNPSTAVRTMAGYVTDGDGGTSNIVSGTLTIIPANDAPVISGVEATTLAYTENGAATTITSTLALTDVDNANLTGATVQITGNYASGQDVLAFSDQNGITGSWNASTGVLSLTGSSSVANYQSALRSITFVNSSDNPNTVTRTVTFIVNDGALASTAATRNISVNAVNDAPVLNSASLTVSEGQTVTLSPANFSLTDPDNSSFTYTISNLTGGYFQLSPAAGSPITSFTSAQLTANQVQFVDDGNEVAPGFSATVNDGTVNSNTLAATINYSPVNDAPTDIVVTRYLSDQAYLTKSMYDLTIDKGHGGLLPIVLDGVAYARGLGTHPGPTGDGFGYVDYAINGATSFKATIGVNDYQTGTYGSVRFHIYLDGALAYSSPVLDSSSKPIDLNINTGNVTTLRLAIDNANNGNAFDHGVWANARLEGGSVGLASVPEGVANGTLIGNVVGVDIDNPENWSYALINNAGGRFAINAATGMVSVADGSLLNFEAAATHDIIVRATDTGGLSVEKVFTISLVDVNEAPVMKSASLTVSEGQTVTLSAVNFEVADQDNSSFTFNVTHVSGGYFQLSTTPGSSINSFTSAQLANKLVQFVDNGDEIAPSFSVTVSDGNLSSNSVTAVIKYTPVNDAPVADAGTEYTIAEGDSLTLNASASSDADGDNLSFAWDLDNDGVFGEVGEPDSVNPTLSLDALRSLGINDNGVYSIGLQVSDGNGGITRTSATLNVRDTAPVMTISGSGSVIAGETYTIKLSTSDPGNDKISSWTINWGDGVIETYEGNPDSAKHTYTQSGMTFNVLASVTDEDGTHIQNQLLVPSWAGTNSIFSISPDGTVLGEFRFEKDLDDPVEIISGPDGNLYVSSWRSGTVQRYTPDGKFIDNFIQAGEKLGLTALGGLSFGPDGNLYVVSYADASVYRFDGVKGTLIDQFVKSGNGGLKEPLGIAFGVDGDLYVSSRGTEPVLRFDGKTGELDKTFVTEGYKGSNMSEDITFGPDGNLYVANSADSAVYRFDVKTGAFIDSFVTPGSGHLDGASGLTFGPDGNLYVASQNSDEIKIYDGIKGDYLGDYVSAGSGGLDSPAYLNFLPLHQVSVTNAAPVNTVPGAQTVNEDSTLTISGISIFDYEDSLASVQLGVVHGVLSVDLAGGAGISSGMNSSNSLTLVGSQSQINAALATLAYRPTLNYNGSDTLSILATDIQNATDSSLVTINVMTVNDAPVLTRASLTISEGQTITLGAANFTVSDPDNTSFTYTVSNVTGGYFQLAADSGRSVTHFTSGELANGQVQFVHDGNEIAPSFNIKVNDGRLDSNTLAAAISYTVVNDAAVLNSASLTVAEGQTVTLSGASLGVSDPDNTNFTFTLSNVSGGYFQLSTTPGASISSFSSAQLAANLVQFVDNGDEVAPTFSLTVNDGTTNSNTLEATVIYTAVNDAPINTVSGNGAVLPEDVTIQLLNALSIADADAGSGNYTVTLSVSSEAGVLTASSIGGVTVTGSGTDTLVLNGSLDAINAYFTSADSAPIFTAVADFNGVVSFTVVTNDNGNYGSGGEKNDSDTISGTISAQTDIADDNIATDEDTAVTFSPTSNDNFENANCTITHINGSAVNIGETIAVAGGRVMLNVTGTLTYTPDTDYNGSPSFTYTVNSGGVLETATVNLTVNAVNDAPISTIAPISYNATEQTSLALQGTGLSIADVEAVNTSSSVQATISVIYGTLTATEGSSGAIVSGSGSATVTLTGTLAQINDLLAGSGTLVYIINNDAPPVSDTLTLTANDQGNSGTGGVLTGFDAATIDIAAVNDAPVITSVDSANIDENTAATTVIYNATAADIDGDNLSWSLTGADAGLLDIDAGSGTVKLKTAADYETKTSYSFNVMVSDGIQTATKSVTLTVNNLNDNSVSAISDINNITNAVAENAVSGALVGITAAASDADSGASISYSLTNNAGGRFAIDSATGVVTVADGSLLDYESATSHSITVLATSSDGSSNSQSFTINLTNLNDNPVSAVNDSNVTANSIIENAATGSVVGIMALASDADAGASISYSLSDDAGGRFAIDSSTGVVAVADGSLLDYDSATSHSITVLATSSDGSSNSQSFTINVSNLNDNQVTVLSDSNATANGVSENAATGTLVGLTATASDADSGAIISYSLSDDAGGRFAINSATGVVTVADGSLLDYENATSHNITVLASSSDGSSNSQTFSVAVTNVNDNAVIGPTDSNASPNSVAENAATGSVVGITALANDADTDATISYSLSDNAGGRFTIDSATGVVMVADGSLLDYEQATSYSITLLASSSDGSSNSQTFSVAVTNVNDNAVTAPADSNASLNSVSENAASGTVVGITAMASDADSGATISYSLSEDAGGRFSIDSATGVVMVADGSLLDYENATSHSITVMATSSDGSSNSQSFTINVSNLNDNPVSAVSDSNATANSVNENAATGSAVGITALATEADAGATIRYSLSDDAGGRFAIDSATGVVTVVDGSLLDYESATNHSIIVLATSSDGSTNSQTFTIDLTNLNDNAPVLNSTRLTISEGQTITLDRVSFDIADLDSNALTYTPSNISGGYFQLASTPGVSITSFNDEDLANGQVQFVHDGSETFPAFNLSVNDGFADSNTIAATFNYTPIENPVISVMPDFSQNPVTNNADAYQSTQHEDSFTQDKADSIEQADDASVGDAKVIVDLNAYIDNLIAENKMAYEALAQGSDFYQANANNASNQASLADVEKNMAFEEKDYVKRRFLSVTSSLSTIDFQTIDTENTLTEIEEKEFWNNLERISKHIDSPDVIEEIRPVDIKVVLGTSVSLTAGFVSWILRAGSLMASFMSTVPLLRRFDPLPILRTAKKFDEPEATVLSDGDEDSESEKND